MKNKKLIATFVALNMIMLSAMSVFANMEIGNISRDNVSTYEQTEVNQEKRIILKFKDKSKKETFLKKKSRKIKKNVKQDNDVSMLSDEYSVISLNSDDSMDNVILDIIDEYSNDIEFVQPDYQINVFANEDDLTESTIFEPNELYNDIKPVTTSSKNEDIIVAVIDTGIDVNHQSYVDKIYKNTSEQKNGSDTDDNGYIDDIYGWDFVNHTDQSGILLDSNHGTHVTGLIAANGIGVGANAKILPLKVFENGIAYTSDILNAIEYAENMGAKIVNCSWGTTSENPALEEAIKNSDMLFICAAGNSAMNVNETPVYPASYEFGNVISVGGSNDRDYLAYFSNYGNKVDVVANGYNVNSTFVNNHFGKMNGTSMSAAYVTGVAAAIYTSNAHDTKERLLNSCDKISTLQDKVNQGRRINFHNAKKGIVVNDIQENTAIDYQEEHEQEIKNSSDSFELYDLDPEPAQIYAGTKHSVVVNNWGLVRTYGDNTYNQLGKKRGDDEYASYIYDGTVKGIDYVRKVSTFENHNLALMDGVVFAWGDNSHYQLGHTNGNTNEMPTKVEFFDSENSEPYIVDIAAGGWFSLALDSEGNVWAWGDNTYGQMALGYSGGKFSNPRIVMSGVSEISAGKYHALAIKNGIVYGWGRNATDYPLGVNAKWSQPTPIPIFDFAGTICDIEAGDRCSFLTTSNGVYVLGLNKSGQLGDGTTTTHSTSVLLDIENVVNIESNEGTTLFLKSNGDVYACGANTYGQLGQGYANTRLEAPIKVPGENYKKIAVGGYHNLLFKCNEEYPEDQWYYRNATIYAIGCNESEQCIKGTENYTYPTIVREIINTEDIGPFSWDNPRPIDATYVVQNGPDQYDRFYGDSVLKVNYTEREHDSNCWGEYSYLKFDISNVRKERIASAKLHLYVENGEDNRKSIREIGVYDTYTNEWDGKTMTWDDGRVGARSLLGTFNVTATGHMIEDVGWHEVDITDYLRNNCIDDELSLMLKAISGPAYETIITSGIYNRPFTFQDMHENRNMPVLEINYDVDTAINRTNYNSFADTYTYQQASNTNFSDSELLGVNYTADESRSDYWGQEAYIAFNISNTPKRIRESIERATLWLYVDESSDKRSSMRTIDVFGNDGLRYNSNNITWNSTRLSGQARIGGFAVTGNGLNIVDSGWKQIDVTNFIKSSINADVEFVLKMTSEQAHPVKIRSSEHGVENTRPRLVIDTDLSILDVSDILDISDSYVTETSSRKKTLYKYIPNREDEYIFSSINGVGLSAILLDENLNEIAISDEVDGDFKIEYHLEKNKSYYIKVLSEAETDIKYKLYIETPLIITIQ